MSKKWIMEILLIINITKLILMQILQYLGGYYKAWAQMTPFIIMPYLSNVEKKAWMGLTKVPKVIVVYLCLDQYHLKTPKQVFQLCYCNFYNPDSEEDWRALCTDFVDSITTAYPELSKKHVVDSMKAFGPTLSYCTERYNTNP